MRFSNIAAYLNVLTIVSTGVAALDESWNAVDALTELQEQALKALNISASAKKRSSGSCTLANARVRQDWYVIGLVSSRQIY